MGDVIRTSIAAIANESALIVVDIEVLLHLEVSQNLEGYLVNLNDINSFLFLIIYLRDMKIIGVGLHIQ